VPDDFSSVPARKPRADAERNRLRLLHAARAAFAKHGALVSMEEVARSAGVGIGTLYRHFATRDELVLEVYRNEIMRLCREAESLAAAQPPLDALREWLLLFVDHLDEKIALGEAVKATAGDAKADVTDQLMTALDILVARPVAEGKIADPGIEPLDLLRALYGIATTTPGPNWVQAARRMVDILISGMRSDPSQK
jgi:AcrR family transcriptional regulator